MCHPGARDASSPRPPPAWVRSCPGLGRSDQGFKPVPQAGPRDRSSGLGTVRDAESSHSPPEGLRRPPSARPCSGLEARRHPNRRRGPVLLCRGAAEPGRRSQRPGGPFRATVPRSGCRGHRVPGVVRRRGPARRDHREGQRRQQPTDRCSSAARCGGCATTGGSWGRVVGWCQGAAGQVSELAGGGYGVAFVGGEGVVGVVGDGERCGGVGEGVPDDVVVSAGDNRIRTRSASVRD